MKQGLRKWTRSVARALLACIVLALASGLLGTALGETADAPTRTIDLTALCNAGIALLCALVTYRLVPWIKARASKEQQEALALAARTAVYAAEQLYRTGAIQDRLAYAEEWLGEHGYTVDRAQIEAQVKQLRMDGVMESALLANADEEGKNDE